MDIKKDFAIKLFKKSPLKQRKFNVIKKLLPNYNDKECLDIGSDNGVISYLLRKNGGKWSSADLVPETVMLIKEAGLRPSAKCSDAAQPALNMLVQTIKNLGVHPTDTLGFESAQVCAGGVNLDEIDLNTMESKINKNLYFAGEILDVDGRCGGYNLQWAWASGRLAGLSAAEK